MYFHIPGELFGKGMLICKFCRDMMIDLQQDLDLYYRVDEVINVYTGTILVCSGNLHVRM